MDPLLNREIGRRYLTQAFLGAGAHARVFRAWDAVRNGRVALKLYRPNSLDAQQAEAAANFEVWEGAAVLPLLEVHPEFLEGEVTIMPLAAGTLAAYDVVFASQATEWTRRVLTGLEFCHGRGVVHGDVKPTNIFRTSRGAILLGDFGVRDFQGDGRRGHTLEYAAPELVLGNARTPQSDVWAAAVTFYELLTGQLPFGGRPADSAGDIADRILRGRFLEPDKVKPYLPQRRFRGLFRDCFTPNPEQRPVTDPGQFRRRLGDLSIRAEWVTVQRPGYEEVAEGHDLTPEGERSGVRYETRIRNRPRKGDYEATLVRATIGGSPRRLTGVPPYHGSPAQCRQQTLRWMRSITAHGRVT